MYAETQESSQLSDIQSELGVDEKAARAMMERAGPGVDVVGLVKMAELTSLPRESRKIARESRRASRAAVGLPTAGVRQAAQSDEATLQSEAERLTKLPVPS